MNKTYKARLWVRKDETIVFSVKFGKGSHMAVTWNITDPASVQDDCKTIDKPAGITKDIDTQDGDNTVAVETEADKKCKFPFRYKNVQYYGCTRLDVEGEDLVSNTRFQESTSKQLMICCFPRSFVPPKLTRITTRSRSDGATSFVTCRYD